MIDNLSVFIPAYSQIKSLNHSVELLKKVYFYPLIEKRKKLTSRRFEPSTLACGHWPVSHHYLWPARKSQTHPQTWLAFHIKKIWPAQ